MTEPYIPLEAVLRLPSLLGARVPGAVQGRAGLPVSSVAQFEGGLVELRGPDGASVVEVVEGAQGGKPDQVKLAPDVTATLAALEVQDLLLKESRRLIARSSTILQSLAQADHRDHNVTTTIEVLAKLVNRPVSFKDADHRLLAWAGVYEQMDAVRRATVDGGEVPQEVRARLRSLGVLERIRVESQPFRIDEDPANGMSSRVVCPVRGAGVLYGYLSIAEGGRSLDPLDFLAVETGATVLSFQVARQRDIDDRERSHRALVAYDLVFGPGGRSEATRRMHADNLGVDLDREHRAIALLASQELRADADRWRRDRDAMLATLDQYCRRRDFPSLMVMAMADGLVVFVAADEPDTVHLARGMARELDAYHPAGELYLGVSALQALPGAWKVAWDEALLAAWVALRDSAPDRVARYRGLGALRLLNSMPQELVDEQLRLTLGANPSFRSMFHETFGALVASGYNKADAARRTYVHVNTLRYRLKRILDVTGHDPADPGDRFTLECALRLLDLQSARTAVGSDGPVVG